MRSWYKLLLVSTFLSPLFVTTTGCSLVPIAPFNHSLKPGGNIFLVTDGGSVQDQAFNQQAYEAAQQFIKDAKKYDQDKKKYPKDPDKVTPFPSYNEFKFNLKDFQPSSISDIIRGDQAALSNDAATVITPGINHPTPLNRFLTMAQSDANNMRVILLDSGFIDPFHGISKSALTSHVSGLSFPGELTAFKAGILTIFYILHHGDLYEPKSVSLNKSPEIKVGGFVGQDFFTATTCFLWGMKQAFWWYDEHKEDFKKLANGWGTIPDAKDPNHKFVTWNGDLPTLTFVTRPNISSGSFEAGAGQAISKWLLSQNCKIIFPVAGPQTEDALKAIEARSDAERQSLRVVGVDTDQTLKYLNYMVPNESPQKQPVIITSAQKGIYKATYNALVDAYTYKQPDMTKANQCWGYGCDFWNNENKTLGSKFVEAAPGVFGDKGYIESDELKKIYDRYVVETGDESEFNKQLTAVLENGDHGMAGIRKVHADDPGRAIMWPDYGDVDAYQAGKYMPDVFKVFKEPKQSTIN